MIGQEKVRNCIKVLFYLLQVAVLLSGAFCIVLSLVLFTKKDSLIPIPSKYLAPITAMCILSLVNGYLGFVCLNSERKTKTFLFILTICALFNIQILLAMKSNKITENNEDWMNERWNYFSIQQKAFIQNKFGCCGLETTTDRASGKCVFDVPCANFFEKMLRTLRSLIQKVLVFMFFLETVSLSTFGFLKFIK